jgi:hypothetical protein
VGTDEEELVMSRRRAIVELANHCAEHGDPKGGVAAAVTEGREQGAYANGPGTSCVELVDCVAFATGHRSAAINRDEHLGRRPQTDLGWFAPPYKHEGHRIWRPRLEQLRPGDFLCYDYTGSAHACVFVGVDEAERAITADYGQPGGRIRRCEVREAGGVLTFRGRSVDAAIDVDTLDYPEPALTVGEWLEAHGLEVEPWTPFEYL